MVEESDVVDNNDEVESDEDVVVDLNGYRFKTIRSTF